MNTENLIEYAFENYKPDKFTWQLAIRLSLLVESMKMIAETTDSKKDRIIAQESLNIIDRNIGTKMVELK